MLILGLLYCLFNSFKECLLTLVGIPFAICGGILALYISGLAFSISAAIGFVSLFGVSVMNGILLITYYNQARLRGGTPAESMFHAASTRMRPLLMTSLSACIGLFPAAISHGIGSQVQRPLATVIVGGMLVGPIMLLVVVPALMILGRAIRALNPKRPCPFRNLMKKARFLFRGNELRRIGVWADFGEETPKLPSSLDARDKHAAGAHPVEPVHRSGVPANRTHPLLNSVWHGPERNTRPGQLTARPDSHQPRNFTNSRSRRPSTPIWQR